MIRFALPLSLVLLALGPEQAAAQIARPLGPDFELRFSPIVGFAPGFSRIEQRHVIIDDRVVQGEFETRFDGGPAAGALIEVRSIGPIRITTSTVVVSRGNGFQHARLNDESIVMPGQLMVLAKAGLSVRLREPEPATQVRLLNASLFAAPAYVLEIPRRDPFSGRRLGPVGSWALNWGADAEAPLGGKLGLQIAVEDYIVYWNRSELERRTEAELAHAGVAGRAQVRTSVSHVWLLRAGLTVLF